jgi:hypothetical protein
MGPLLDARILAGLPPIGYGCPYSFGIQGLK